MEPPAYGGVVPLRARWAESPEATRMNKPSASLSETRIVRRGII